MSVTERGTCSVLDEQNCLTVRFDGISVIDWLDRHVYIVRAVIDCTGKSSRSRCETDVRKPSAYLVYTRFEVIRFELRYSGLDGCRVENVNVNRHDTFTS